MITSDLFTNNSSALFENTGPVTHRIGLTVTDPNHPMVSKRGETIQKTVRVTGDDREKAINSAIAHLRRKGYKVHDHHYIGTVDQGLAEATGDAKFDSMLGNIVKDTPIDFVLSDPRSGVLFKRGFKSREQAKAYNQEKERGYYSVYSYQWWRDTIEPEIPDSYRKKGVAEGLSEMDKSQTPPGRNGSNDEGGKKEYPAKIITPKKAVKDGEKILNKVLNKKQGVAEEGVGTHRPKETPGSWKPAGYERGTHWAQHTGTRKLKAFASSAERRAWLKTKPQDVAEVSLGDYRKKATVNKAVAQANKFFDRDDPAAVAAADQTIAKRERGLARADARIKPYTPPQHDAEKYQRDLTAKYPNIDELVADAEKRRDPQYDYAEGDAYYRGREAEQNYQKLKQIQRVIQGLNESLNRSHLP